MELPPYTMNIEDNVICLTDLKRGLTITNGAELVVQDLAKLLGPDLIRHRIVYRDTTDTYDGIAHRHGRFLNFVPLRTKDRSRALALAKAGIDRVGRDWPCDG